MAVTLYATARFGSKTPFSAAAHCSSSDAYLAGLLGNCVNYGVLRRDTRLSRLELFATFLKIGLFSFSAAATAVIIDLVVSRKKWLTLDELRDKISVAALMPGPFHINLVGLTGNAISGYAGAMLAVSAFVLPGLTLAVALAVTLSSQPLRLFLLENPGIIRGMLIAVGGLLLNVIVKLGRHSLPSPWSWMWVCGLSALLLLVKIHFAFVILGAGLFHVLYVKLKAASSQALF